MVWGLPVVLLCADPARKAMLASDMIESVGWGLQRLLGLGLLGFTNEDTVKPNPSAPQPQFVGSQGDTRMKGFRCHSHIDAAFAEGVGCA